MPTKAFRRAAKEDFERWQIKERDHRKNAWAWVVRGSIIALAFVSASSNPYPGFIVWAIGICGALSVFTLVVELCSAAYAKGCWKSMETWLFNDILVKEDEDAEPVNT